MLISAIVFLVYLATKISSGGNAEEQTKPRYVPVYNRQQVYYTSSSHRAYELTSRGLEKIEDKMKSIAARLPKEAYSTKTRTRTFYLVGGQYHQTEPWTLFFGKCKPEDNNQYDKNAVAVYNSVGKLMGYLSKEDAVSYRENFGAAQTWCYGFTYETKKGNVAAKLTCLGELFPSPKGQKTPALDIIRGGLVEYYGEMGYFKDHQHRNEEEYPKHTLMKSF